MLKKFIKNLSALIISILIVVFIFSLYVKYLDKQIINIYNDAYGKVYAQESLNKGITLLKYAAENDDLIILGSSELSSHLPQNVKNMFPNTQLESDVIIVGKAYSQSLIDAIKVSAMSDSFKDKKIVLIVSLQWFLNDDINKDGFMANLSEIQFYKLIHNTDISSEEKKYICERITKLTTNESRFDSVYLYAYLYQKDNFISKTIFAFLKPYYCMRENYLTLKDKYEAYQTLKTYINAPPKNSININWSQEENLAEKMGKQSCTNNNFFVNDEYYSTYLEPNIAKIKNCYAQSQLTTSKEYDDYKLLLKICKENKINPYIIFTPANGYYYDYAGLSQETRSNYYNKITDITEDYGFDYVNLSNKEYEPYFLSDIMHLGWKGWLYVDKQITEYFSKNQK